MFFRVRGRLYTVEKLTRYVTFRRINLISTCRSIRQNGSGSCGFRVELRRGGRNGVPL